MRYLTYQFEVFYGEETTDGTISQSDWFAGGEASTLDEAKKEADFYGSQIANPIIHYYERREIHP